jgi:hypothetical protein
LLPGRHPRGPWQNPCYCQPKILQIVPKQAVVTDGKGVHNTRQKVSVLVHWKPASPKQQSLSSSCCGTETSRDEQQLLGCHLSMSLQVHRDVRSDQISCGGMGSFERYKRIPSIDDLPVSYVRKCSNGDYMSGVCASKQPLEPAWPLAAKRCACTHAADPTQQESRSLFAKCARHPRSGAAHPRQQLSLRSPGPRRLYLCLR